MLPRVRQSWGAVVLVLGGAGCGEGSSPTEPIPPVACDLAAPGNIGVPLLLPPGAPCLSLTSSAHYALAYFDPRFVEGSRSGAEATAPTLPDFSVTVIAGDDAGGPHPARTSGIVLPPPAERPPPTTRDRWVRIETTETDTPDVLEQDSSDGRTRTLPAACTRGPGFEVFCRDRPWSRGDTLTIPAPFGMFIDETPRPAEILLVRGPFAFAVPRDLSASQRALLRPLLAELALAGRVRILPFLRRALVDRPVFTSPGSRQILVDAFVDVAPVCVCGVTVGNLRQDTGVAGVSIRVPIGAEFEAARIGLFAHELTHMWQHAFDVDRAADPTAGVAPTTVWAREGGADFVRQEILRGLADEPLDANLDADAVLQDPFLERWLRDLGVANGRIRDGYAQTAGLFRHLFVRALGAGGDYDEMLRAILLGSLEGWFGVPAANASGAGLTDRLSAALPDFQPTAAVLEYALANAVDDRIESTRLRNPAVLDAWRKSTGSRFVPTAKLSGRTGAVTVRQPAGSLGYIYLEPDTTDTTVRLTGSVEGIRWMVVRFE